MNHLVIAKICTLNLILKVSPWLWSDLVFYASGLGRGLKKSLKELHGFTDKVIQERKAAFKQEQASKNSNKTKEEMEEEALMGKKKRLAFLDMLIENGSLSDTDIREEVDTFMFEGHDTTAANISFSLCLLAAHQDIQTRVHEELDGIFGDDKERPITIDDMSNMKYLESCLKESLRMFPSVPFMTRTVWEDCVIEVK